MAKLIIPIRRRRVRRALIGGVLVASTVLAGGCSGTLEDVWPDRQPSYRSSRSAPPLEVPPDLTSSTLRDSLQIPGVDATHSQYASDVASGAARSASAVLPEIDDARIERGDGQRWLVIAMKPEETWPRLRDFWISQGFAIETEEPDIGVMETDWAEEHIPLPAGILKRAVQRISDALYGVAIRDQYRTRIERGAEPDTTEIYISHRGAEQVVVGNETHAAQVEGLGKTVWQPRPNDPGLESEMLSRLMVFLGADQERANAVVAASTSPEPRARLVREDDGTTALVLGDGFSPAWRRTGLALDRAGLTVEDRDRSRGLFFVRYAGREDSAQSEDKGWLSKLKFWGNDDDEDQGGDAYVVQVVGETPATSRVVVLDRNGVRDETPTASRILTVLHEQIE
jgi:outer membrane protein assembly factor BamC